MCIAFFLKKIFPSTKDLFTDLVVFKLGGETHVCGMCDCSPSSRTVVWWPGAASEGTRGAATC